MAFKVMVDGRSHEVEIVRRRPHLVVRIDGREHEVSLAGDIGDGRRTIEIAGLPVHFAARAFRRRAQIIRSRRPHLRGQHRRPVARRRKHGSGAPDHVRRRCRAPWCRVHKAVGDAVTRGETMVMIESMKLETARSSAARRRDRRTHVAGGRKLSRRTRVIARLEAGRERPEHAPHRVDARSTSSAEFRRNAAHNRGARRRVARKQAGGARMSARSATSTGCSARTRCSCASASSCCSIPARRSSSCRRWPPTWPTTARCRAPASSAASASSSGREVIIHADDASVKGGAWYPLSGQEDRAHARHRDREPAAGRAPVRQRRRLPAAAGGNLRRPLHGRPHLPQPGDPLQARRAAGRGRARPLHGGRRLRPGLCDYNVIVRGTGAIFLGGPPLVKAATGEDVTVEELGGADMHTSISGTADYPAATKTRRSPSRREIVGAVAEPPKKCDRRARARRSRRTTIRRSSTASFRDDIKKQFDMREVIARIVDGSRFHEYQPAYGTTLVCGFATSGASRSASSPTTACCSTTAR